MIRENQTVLNRLNVLIDAMLVFSSFLLGFWIRFFILPGGVITTPFRAYFFVALMLIPLHLMTYSSMDLYTSFRKKRLYQELCRLFTANTLDFIILQMGFFLLKDIHFSRLALALFFLLVNASLGLKRLVLRKLLHAARKKGYNQKHIIIVGAEKMAQDCVKAIQSSPDLGYQISGYVSDASTLSNLTRLGSFADLGRLLDEHSPDEVIAALGMDEYTQMPNIIQQCETTGTKLSLIPFYACYMPAHPQIDSLNGIPLINLRRIPLDNLGNAFLKRAMDIIGALTLIVLTSPIMLLVAAGVKLSSPGPVIFNQERVGLNKKTFYMYKFRSMTVNGVADTSWSKNSDSRKTRFGALIRKFSIDELPQFFNVLMGDMSLVGPRPELPHFVELFKEDIPLYMVKHQVRPGITGWAQVHGLRGDTSIKARVEHDIFYIENWSAWLDIKILFMTLFKGVVNRETLH